tara:strand:+ start:220 stop:522 length:303 start_codon:yes stop_codon:yes gene_type:complete
MKILNPTNSKRYTIDGITLYGFTYLRHKVEKKLIELLKDEFSENDIVYDIVMNLTSEFGDNYHIEEMIKILESFYNRDLTMLEIKSCIEAYNDYQNGIGE